MGHGAWGSFTGIPGIFQKNRAGLAKRDIKRLQSLQNKVLRLVDYKDIYTPTRELLKTTKQLSVNQLIAFHIGKQTYKIQKSEKPDYHFERLFDKNFQPTRTRPDNIKRIDFRLNSGQSSFFCQASRLWSAIPFDISNTNRGVFKSKLKEWIWDNIPIKP